MCLLTLSGFRTEVVPIHTLRQFLMFSHQPNDLALFQLCHLKDMGLYAPYKFWVALKNLSAFA